MSSAAAVSRLLRPEPSPARALPAASQPLELARLGLATPSNDRGAASEARAERASSAREAPAAAGRESAPPESTHRPVAGALHAELVAMLPSLERHAYRWCRDPAEARDLAHDTVVRALGNNPRFDSEGHLRAWLYTVLRNLFISRCRREQSWQRACGELTLAASKSTEPSPPPFLTGSVERALERLPEPFASVVRLVDLEDYTYADAASALGVPVGTVMSRLFRARQRLARDLPELA